ncbi:MAG: glycosyltransferase family 2 protein [bacterium]
MPETPSAPVCPERIRPMNGCGDTAPDPVLYWMSRDQRAADTAATTAFAPISRLHNRLIQGIDMSCPENNTARDMISIILPVYKNADFLEELIRRLHHTLDTRGIGHDIIAVNDCGPDASLQVLQALLPQDPRLILVELKRNGGQHRAVLTGLTCVSGEWFAVMDADLQDAPEDLPALLDLATATQAVVFAGRRGRYESTSRLWTSRLYKTLLSALTGVPRDAGMFFVAPSGVKDKLLSIKTRTPAVVAMLGGLPIRKISLPVERSPRPSGTSGYSSRLRLKAGLRAIRCAWQCRLDEVSSINPDYTDAIRSITRGKDLMACPR